MLYTSSLESIHLTTGSLYSLTNNFLFPPPLSPCNHHFTLCFLSWLFYFLHISEIYSVYLPLSDLFYLLILLSIMPLSFIHAVTKGKLSIYSMAEQYSTVCVYPIFFIHSYMYMNTYISSIVSIHFFILSIKQHICYFHVFTTVNNTTMTMGV